MLIHRLSARSFMAFTVMILLLSQNSFAQNTKEDVAREAADTPANNAPAGVDVEKIVWQETAEEREQRMAWWKEARFGMFVHWGLYSVAAGHWDGKPVHAEWIQCFAKVPTAEYERVLTPGFKPTEDFARQWAAVAKSAGCQYVVFTTKHHDGFALHDSKVSDFDAMDITGRDLVKEIVDACRAEGLRVGFYHSVIDWHHPHAYVGMGLPAIAGDTNEGRDHDQYIEYLHAQCDELFSNYGKVDVVWWDYSSSRVQGDSWRADELLAKVRRMQPGIISNNRLYAKAATGGTSAEGFNYSHGDYLTPEQKIPATGLGDVYWETCMTMNGSWGYHRTDHKWKSTKRLVHNLIDIASKGGNYLLNIGPKGDGSVPAESVERMAEIGRWMKVYGESIYRTDASPFKKLPFDGRVTQKTIDEETTRLYLHVFSWPENGQLTLNGLSNAVRSVRLLHDNSVVEFEKSANEVSMNVPDAAPNEIASVVVVDIVGDPEVNVDLLPVQLADGTLTLGVSDFLIIGKTLDREGSGNLGFWTDASDRVIAPFVLHQTGDYRLSMEIACEPGNGGQVEITLGARHQFDLDVAATNGWQDYTTVDLGEVTLAEGHGFIHLVPQNINGALMNLRSIRLVPVEADH